MLFVFVLFLSEKVGEIDGLVLGLICGLVGLMVGIMFVRGMRTWGLLGI